MADGADIPLPDTGVPVELDRIYSSLRDLSEALGPNGVNKDGTLDHVLAASRRNLGGQGRLGNRMIRNLSRAASTFGQGSGDLFETVTQLAKFSQVLGDNDRLVRAFVTDLSGVSGSLASERVQLSRALEAVARAVGTVREFVHGNRAALVTDLEKLTRVMKNINSERGSIDDALQVAPLALGNLAVAFNNQTGSIGSRIGVNGTFGDLDGFLCSIVMQSGMPRASKDLACKIFKQIEPAENQTGKQPTAGRPHSRQAATRQSPSLSRIEQRSTQQYVDGDGSSLSSLMGGGA
jgi:phospholipid/cholesterol/gamma-HCH transport system substrate-binding protein